MNQPTIHIKKDGPLFRVNVIPPQKLAPSVARSESYVGIIAAKQAAEWLSDATGWAVVDLVSGGKT